MAAVVAGVLGALVLPRMTGRVDLHLAAMGDPETRFEVRARDLRVDLADLMAKTGAPLAAHWAIWTRWRWTPELVLVLSAALVLVDALVWRPLPGAKPAVLQVLAGMTVIAGMVGLYFFRGATPDVLSRRRERGGP
ncbi:MAG: hypothetical protein AAGC57_09470 [Pseudomonadota bacterium]